MVSSDFEVYYYSDKNFTTLKPHAHDYYECYLFIEGDVTYSNDAKMRRLGVRKETLDTVGAVSEECAREMAEGTRKAAGTDFALSTTGYAGPDGGEPDKPVGTVFIALASADGTTVKRLNLFGDRDRIRHSAMLNALDLLRRKLCTK